MTSIGDEYYFAFRPDVEEIPILQADDKARAMKYRYHDLSAGGAPLRFANGFRAEFLAQGMIENITDILHDAPFCLINADLHAELQQFPTRGLNLYPAVYIDNQNQYHENYWFTNFYQSQDIIDWDGSEFDVVEGETPEDNEYLFDRIRLAEDKLGAIPEPERMLLHIKTLGYIIFHQHIVDFVERQGLSGINFFKVHEFEDGDQYV